MNDLKPEKRQRVELKLILFWLILCTASGAAGEIARRIHLGRW